MIAQSGDALADVAIEVERVAGSQAAELVRAIRALTRAIKREQPASSSAYEAHVARALDTPSCYVFLAASRAFYEKLGFEQIAGDQAQNWLILQNSTSTIGLFQGPQYTRNMLTFNPGWDRTGNTLPDFDDVRDIQRTLESRGIVPTTAADESSTGPASLVLTDPDGNPILIDQHVPKPRK